MTTVPSQTGPGPLPEDRMASELDEFIREHIWNYPGIRLDGSVYGAVGDDEDPGMDEFDVVLRGPDGTLYDVEIEVQVSRRAAQATT